MTWEPFQLARFTPEQLVSAIAESAGLPSNEIIPDRVYRNNKYQVNVWDRHPCLPDGSHGFPRMIWLSIKRVDKEVIHDWRDLQRIKDEIVGKDHDAVELYPADSRLVDTANQYHLFVLHQPGLRFPFGWTTRMIGTPDDAAIFGAVQRPFGEQQHARS